MAELDLWSDANVIGPLFSAAVNYDDAAPADWSKTVEQVKRAIRQKTLDSYHNGLKAAGRKPERRGA